MIRSTTFAGQTVAVFGLGTSGLASVRALVEGGASVAAWDENAESRAALDKYGIVPTDLTTADWSLFAALVLAPGVPLTHPEPHWTVARAKSEGIEIIGDVELFARERAKTCPEAPFIAITGTNGKSTTTALVSHILREAGFDVQMGGNIGRAILTLEPPSSDRVHVIEMSSFQIDLTPTLTPTVGVLLNISPDHLDRHGTVEQYAAIKERLVTTAGVAVIGVEDSFCAEIAHKLERAGRIVRRVRTEKPGPYEYGLVNNTVCYESPFDGLVGVVNLDEIATLRGRHNAQNAIAAFAATLDLVEPAKYSAAFQSFPGLRHRMEEIGSLGPILFVNDSKATNVDSAEKALASWDRDVYWIAGGRPKQDGIDALVPYFGRVKGAYLIGESSDMFAGVLEGRVRYHKCGTLDRALKEALDDAQANDGASPVILFSPACASFDQYRNFEVRGDHFCELVSKYPGVLMRPRATV